MDDISQVVAINWEKAGLSAEKFPLLGVLQTVYDDVISRAIHHMRDDGPSQVLASSGNALANLSVEVLLHTARKAYTIEDLGINHPDFDGQVEEVREILKFVCTETLERYFGAIRELGYEAKSIAKDLEGVKSGAIRGIEELSRLSNRWDNVVISLVAPFIPVGGWSSLRPASPPKAELGRLSFGYL